MLSRQRFGLCLTTWTLTAGLLLVFDAGAARAQQPAPPGDASSADSGQSTNPPSLQLLGYADANFDAEWPDAGSASSSFRIGEFDLLFTSTLGQDWSALAELVIEAENGAEFAVDLERAVLTYAPRDTFTLSMGRFHSVLSYYNSSFPHASWYQVATNRPFSQDFEDEGGLLPSHSVGFAVSSRLGGPLRPRFVFEATNGTSASGIGTSAPKVSVQSSRDENSHKAVVGAVQFRPVKVPGLQFGVAAFVDKVGPSGLPEVSERITSGHVVFQDDKWEWITEAYGIRHQLPKAAAANSSAVYTQVARQFGQSRPFFRYERLQLSEGDPLHAEGVGTTQGPSFGVRFDPSRFVGVKTQFDWLTHSDRDGRKRFVVQVSFAF